MLGFNKTANADEEIMVKEEIKVLYLDDDFLDQKLMSLHMQCDKGAAEYDLTCVSSIDAAVAALGSQEVDVLIIDNMMPQSPNFHFTLEKLGKISRDIKLVVTSSEIQSRTFKEIDHLDRKPDAIVEKGDLRQFIGDGNLRVA